MNDPLMQLSGSSFNLDAALATVRKRLWLIVAIAVSVPALVGLVVSKQPKIYQANATLIIDSSVPQYLGQNFKDVVEIESAWWNAQETMQTELSVIHSLSESIAYAKALCTHNVGKQRAIDLLIPGADCESQEQMTRAGMIVQGMTHAEPRLEHAHRGDHRRVATTPRWPPSSPTPIGETYAARNLARRLSQSEGAATWLGDEYGDLTTQLAKAEQTLIDFKKRNNVVAVSLEDQQSDLAAKRRKICRRAQHRRRQAHRAAGAARRVRASSKPHRSAWRTSARASPTAR